MVIGGIAVILNGVPRATRDVDATVDASSMPIEDVLEHFASFGIRGRISDVADFARVSQVLLLRHEGSGVDVDLSLAWLPFELEALEASSVVVRRGLRARIARPEDLIIYKSVAWRPQDQQDIERLLALHMADIDLERVRLTVAALSEAIEQPGRLAELEELVLRAKG
jgi:predicted nucleotidyltransferase